VPLAVPNCQHELLLALPAYHLVSCGLDQYGVGGGSMNVPFVVRGAPFYWQVVMLPPNCSLSCPVMIGFPL